MRTIPQAADLLSTSCFLNSFLREQPERTVHELPKILQERSGVNRGFCLPLQEHPDYAALWIPLRRHSTVGRHRYALPLFCVDRRGLIEAVNLVELADILLHEPSMVGVVDKERHDIFLQRLRESRVMIEEALVARRADIDASYGRKLSFFEAEQLLIAGHSFHPTPKSRDEFTAVDRAIYSPEMGGSFPLAWVIAHPRYVRERRSTHFKADWLQDLIASDPKLALHVPAGMRVLPMHPWQAEKLKKHPSLQKALRSGAIRFLSAPGSVWHPTSSLRSLYRAAAPYMLKFSLSLKLTNSIRHLLVHEVERGLQVYDVLENEHGQEFLRRQTLHIIREPAYAMLVGDEGELLHESIVVCRENPIRHADDPQPLVLATLTQEDPLGRDNLIVQHIKAWTVQEKAPLHVAARMWFRQFCRVALEPFMVAQADFGILLGAHQQNMLISLKDHFPEQVYFRDCQGTGYAEWAYEKLREQVPLERDNGNILLHEMEAALFTYYLVINTSFNVIAAIADSEAIDENELLMELRQLVEELIERRPRDSQLLQDLLEKDTLLYKGNFQCSVRSINENTSTNPLSIYRPIRNPLHTLSALKDRDMYQDPVPIVYQAPGSSFAVVICAQDKSIFARRGDQTLMQFTYDDGRLSLVQDHLGPERERIHLRVIEFVFGHNPDLRELDGTELQAPWHDALNQYFLQKREERLIVDRRAFFQYPPLWHRRQEPGFVEPERWISTQGRLHPQRSFIKPGLLYRRYLPSIRRTLSFELFDRAKHLDAFHEWHNQPRVAQFWEMAHSREKLDEYIGIMEKDPHQRPIIALLDDLPIGYFEVYWTPEDRLGPYYEYDPFDRGFHFLIGDVGALGRKGTPEIIQSMVHFIFLDDPRTRRIMGEPRHDNIKLLRYLQTIPGWVKIKEFDFPHKRAALLQIRREDFFAGGSL